MPNYQIKLTPVDNYFFGGEKHKLNDKKQLAADYFVESNLYPQQTTMLGMLRYYLLYRSGNLIFSHLEDDEIKRRREAAPELIGKKSFAYNSANQFGKIQSISPLYFLHQNKGYHFAPFDYNFNYKNGVLIDEKEKPYNAKDHYYPISKQRVFNGVDVKELSKIITDVQHTGNKKAKPGELKLDGYYKMNKKKLAAGWCFAFDTFVDLEGLEKETTYVQLGGEKSIFKIEFKQIEAFNTPTIPAKYKRDAETLFLYFTSDAFIKNDDLKAVDFAVNQFVSFRCMQSTIETANYNKLPEHNDDNGVKIDKEDVMKKGLYRSCRFQLLKRGSVLYFDKKTKRDEFEEKLKNTPEHKFGFNHYLKN